MISSRENQQMMDGETAHLAHAVEQMLYMAAWLTLIWSK
jgi:hypothetical protein